MTPEQLRELIAGAETLDVEFKGEEKKALSDSDLVDAVVCLSNRPGAEPGWLLIGVEDDGRVTGSRPRHEAGSTDTRRVQAVIANLTRPSVSCRADVVSLDGRQVIAIEVSPSRHPVGLSNGLYVRRAVGSDGRPACVPYPFHEMQSHEADRGQLDYSTAVVPEARWADLDPLEFERYRRNIRESRGQGDRSLLDLTDLELAKALGAVVANGEVSAVRVLGLLLFGKEEALRSLIPTHEVAFQQLARQKVEANDFFRLPLVRTMEELLSRWRARNREQELMVGALRVGVPDYPELALREAVANALIHRDYTRLGAVHVQWHEDRIEVSSPGGFPEGVRLDNLLVTPPRPRNPLLADAFKRAGIVDRTGRGIDTIFHEQLRNGRPPPSYDATTEAAVVLVLPGGAANLEFVRVVVEENQAGRDLRLNELLVLHAVRAEGRITAPQAATVMQRPDAEARRTLTQLIEAGLLEARGELKGRTYHLSADTYRRLGAPAAYVRQRGFEPLQQEQMVLQYVQKHGRITRGQAAELCRMGPYQASRLLGRLVREERLLMHGTRKMAWYGPRS